MSDGLSIDERSFRLEAEAEVAKLQAKLDAAEKELEQARFKSNAYTAANNAFEAENTRLRAALEKIAHSGMSMYLSTDNMVKGLKTTAIEALKQGE